MYSCFADVERACAGRGIAPARLFLENEMRLTGRTEKEIYDMMGEITRRKRRVDEEGIL